MWFLTVQNLNIVPRKGKFALKITAGLFFFSWASFPAMWILGSPGLSVISQGSDVVLHCIADFFSKNLFGLAAWYVKWYSLVEDQKSTTVMRRKFLGDNLVQQSALSQEEVKVTKAKTLSVLLFCSDKVVYKLQKLMLEKLGVKIQMGENVEVIKVLLLTAKPDDFDAVIVFPGRCSDISKEHLLEVSNFISKSPYKLPMLGCYYKEEELDTVTKTYFFIF